ncbi:MAG: prepilin-type N-terminal cleavage/methylation domain-containing protein [Planctomycetota bacterium]|jgi:general secretion pathway protein H
MKGLKVRNLKKTQYGDESSGIICPWACAFTLVEIMVVVIILGIAAAIVVPMAGSASGMQLSSAATKIAADMEYAKSIAISRQQNYSVIFDAANDSYEIRVTGEADPIEHPVKRGFDYAVDFQEESNLDQVGIFSAVFGSTSEIIFDYLGSPKDGSGNDLSAEGVITLKADGSTKTVSVEPVTGFMTISQ